MNKRPNQNTSMYGSEQQGLKKEEEKRKKDHIYSQRGRGKMGHEESAGCISLLMNTKNTIRLPNS